MTVALDVLAFSVFVYHHNYTSLVVHPSHRRRLFPIPTSIPTSHSHACYHPKSRDLILIINRILGPHNLLFLNLLTAPNLFLERSLIQLWPYRSSPEFVAIIQNIQCGHSVI